jgi:CRP/FNR family transcriptional regulator, cyclic AMP receptor protein
MLKEGSAQLYRLSPNGRKFVLVSVPTGSVFCEMSCIGQGMYDCFAEASEDSVICTLSRSDVTRLIHQHPGFAIRLLESVGRRVLHAERQLVDRAFRGLIPRLATFLIEQARDGELSGLSSGPTRRCSTEKSRMEAIDAAVGQVRQLVPT